MSNLKKFHIYPCEGLPEVKIIEYNIFGDNRGYFYESFNEREFNEAIGQDLHFVQDNKSCSRVFTIRGLHYQVPPHAQDKLVGVARGSIIDFAVDIRKGSPTYGKYVAVRLSEDLHRMLFIPKGFAHGFIAFQDNTILSYKCTDYYDKESERSINIFDDDLNITEVRSVDTSWIMMSEKDLDAIKFKEIESDFIYEGEERSNSID